MRGYDTTAMVALVLAGALTAQPHAAPQADRTEIRQIVQRRHGASTRVNRIIIHGGYALAAGRSSAGAAIDGLRFTHSGWRVVCSLRSEPSPTDLMSRCGFPAGIAAEISADESAQISAESGQFTTAVIAQERAFASATGPDRNQERARFQLLHQLSEQIRTGRITRAAAIQQWNQFRYSWMLP